MKQIAGMRFPWNVWVAMLGVANVGGGIYYWSKIEGKAALIAMMGAFVVMTLVYHKRGFVRLLGLGHIVTWIPLLVLFAMTALNSAPDGAFRAWLWTVIGLNGLSLLIDAADVVRYLRGERGPM